MIVSAHQPQYIPWLGFLHKIAKSDYFVLLDEVQYKHREFQNRKEIRTRSGWMWLSVPVAMKGSRLQKCKDVAIDNHFPWRRQHLHSLKSCYGGCAFFEGHLPFFEDVYRRQWRFLIDLNIHIIRFLMEQFSILTPMLIESELGITSTRTKRLVDICARLSADAYLSGVGAREYLVEGEFSACGIRLGISSLSIRRIASGLSTGGSFLSSMSSLDLLFNLGPQKQGDFITRMNILAIGAHPDDIEFGCAGALLKYVRAGSQVALLILTNGSYGGDPQVRKDEGERAAHYSGGEKNFLGNFRDTDWWIIAP